MDSMVTYLARLKAAMTRVDAELWPQAELSQDLESLMARLKVSMSRINQALWPEATLQNDLESLRTRLNGIPDRVQEWKKSSARCGADVALSLDLGKFIKCFA